MRVKQGKMLIRILVTVFLLVISLSEIKSAKAEDAAEENNAEKEYVIDMTKGYCESSYYRQPQDEYYGFISVYRLMDKPFDYNNGFLWRLDLDGDGTIDLYSYGYDWPEEEGPADRYFLIPAAECSVHGRVSYPVEKVNEYYKFDKITFIFPESSYQKEYAISVENGHAEVDGKIVTSAAPGTIVSIIPDELDGRFVASWNDKLIGEFTRYTTYPNYWTGATAFFMPASDVSLSAKTEKQTPLTFDLQKGFCLADDDGWSLPNPGDFKLSLWYAWEEGTNLIDLDEDGQKDISCNVFNYWDVNGPSITDYLPHHAFFIPLSTSSIKGSYTTSGKSIAAYWPITFTFPSEPVKKLYPVSVEGGHAEDMQGRTITEAAPGERIRIIYDGIQGMTAGLLSSPEYDNLYRKWTIGKGNRLREEIAMPACALSYKALPNEGKTLVLAFYSKDGTYSATVFGDVADAFEKNGNAIDQVLCLYKGLNPRVGDRSLIMDYSGEYYSLEYSLPEPFITDEEIYTSVQVSLGGYQTFYPITCTEEELDVYWAGAPDFRILASVPGQLLYVNKTGLTEPEGYKFSGFEAKDFWMEYTGVYWRLSMPDHAIELKPVYTKVDPDTQTPLTIDLSEGHFNVEDQEILKSIAKTGISYERSNDMYDLDGDGKWDIHVNADLHIIRILSDYSCGEYFTIETGNHGQKYFPITFVNKPKANTETGVTPTVTPAGSEEKPTQNEVTPAGTQAAKNNKAKSKKGGVLLVVFAILAMILVFGGVVGFNILRNRREEALRAQKLAELRRRRAAEAEEFEEPQYEQTAEQTQEPAEPEDEDEEDEDYL